MKVLSRFIIPFSLISLLTFIGCDKNKDDFDTSGFPNVPVVLTLSRVLELPVRDPASGEVERREFEIYLERPDLKLKELDFESRVQHYSDIPLALQTKWKVQFSDATNRVRFSGKSEDGKGFPHRFSMSLNKDEAGKPKTVLIKIVFADNTYAEGEITIPYAGGLDQPVILQPTSAPRAGDKFQIQFKDVGADNYHIFMNICHPYRGDGINPCLKGIDIYVVKEKGKLIVSNPGMYGVSVTTENSLVSLKSSAVFVDAESGGPFYLAKDDTSIRYHITASAKGVTAEGISKYLESNYQVEYGLK